MAGASQRFTAPPRSLVDLYVPRLQRWGFDNRDPILKVGPLSCSFQIFTTGPNENTYSIDRENVEVTAQGGSWTVSAKAFAGAGQQWKRDGSFKAVITRESDDCFSIRARAGCSDPIRAVKVCIHDVPKAPVWQTGWEALPNPIPLPDAGISYNYPEYQAGMPVWLLGTMSFSSADVTSRPRRFVAYPVGTMATVELLFEQFATRFAPSFEMPAWEVRMKDTLESAIERRAVVLESRAGLASWENRADTPDWARDVRLVVTLHGMHWSGYVFHDYRGMLQAARWFTDRVEGRKVLFFLAGWEGRYYRTYGDSVPNERMGGDRAFRELVSGIHAAGAHVMAMYGGNYPQPGTPGYETYAPTSKLDADNGFRWSPMRGYVVDWGQLRGAGMMGGGPPMNPGAPAWRNFLAGQVDRMNSTYGLDGAFFDTQPTSGNDAHYDPVAGLRDLCRDLRSHDPNLLIATESWFDLSLGFVPASQTPGGPTNWTRKYQRRFAHVSMGEPSRGSTGVHELGHLPYRREELLQMFDWPTVGIVDGTLQSAPEEVEAMVAAAKHL